MATVTHTFTPFDATPPASAFATLDVVSGTNTPVAALDFDASSDEAAFFVFRAVSYGSGNLAVEVDWYADSATSGDVVWGVQLGCITPDTDSQDVETKSLGTANTVTDSHIGTTGQRLHRASITLSNTDSIAAGDWCILRLYRDADNGSDTMSGDAAVVLVTVTYSDS